MSEDAKPPGVNLNQKNHLVWYQDKTILVPILVAIVTSVLGSSGIFGYFKLTLEDKREQAKLKVMQQEQKHRISTSYLSQVVTPNRTEEQTRVVLNFIVAIEKHNKTYGDWAEDELKRFKQLSNARQEIKKLEMKAEEVNENLNRLAEKTHANANTNSVIEVETVQEQEKTNSQSAELGQQILTLENKVQQLEGRLSLKSTTDSFKEDFGHKAATKITVRMLTDIGVSVDHAEKYVEPLRQLMKKYSIDTTLRVSHFLAQVLHESAMFRADTENLNYSSKSLKIVFPKYFPTLEKATEYARNPEKIANLVYANRLGNGNEASGDGYKYRGRGLLLVVGKANYEKIADWSGVDLVSNPDKVASEYSVHSAVWYWDTRNLNSLADKDDVALITKKITGGTSGLSNRKELLNKIKSILTLNDNN
jgi:putative chitinase